MPTPRFNFATIVYQNKIYCIGGLTANRTFWMGSEITGAIEVYDPATDSWETKIPMPTPRSQFEAQIINAKIYLMGGRTGGPHSTVTANDVYDPDNESWFSKASMPVPVVLYSSAAIGNKIYVIGGQNEFSDPMCQNTTQIYDTTTDSWSYGAALPTPVHNAASCVTQTTASENSLIYVIGGEPINKTCTAMVQIYNPQTNNWSIGPPVEYPRAGLAAAFTHNAIYAIGGTDRYLLPNESANAENEMMRLRTSAESSEPSPSIPELSLWLLLFPILATTALMLRHKQNHNSSRPPSRAST